MSIEDYANKIANRVCMRAGMYKCAIVKSRKKTGDPVYNVRNADLPNFSVGKKELIGIFSASCSYNEIVDLILWDARET